MSSYRGNQGWLSQQGGNGHHHGLQSNSHRGNYGRNSGYQSRNRYDGQQSSYRNGQSSYNQGGQQMQEQDPYRQRQQRYQNLSSYQQQNYQNHQNQLFQRQPSHQTNYNGYNQVPSNNTLPEGANQVKPQQRYQQHGNSSSYSGGRDNHRNNYSNFYNSYNSQPRFTGDTRNQLWMGDIDPLWDEEFIMNVWKNVGFQPTNVKIMRDRNSDKSYKGKSDYSFVTFSDASIVEQAIQKNGSPIPDTQRVFKLNWTNQGNQQREQSGRPYANNNNNNNAQGGPGIKAKNEFSLYVGDLSGDVKDQLLFEAFEKVLPGQVLLAKVMFDPMTKLSKGFGFVRVATADVQTKAISEMNGVIIGGNAIRVGMASGGGENHGSGGNFGKSNSTENEVVIVLNQYQPPLNQYTDPNNTTLLVKGLSNKVSEDELIGYFISFGDIVSCKLTYDMNTGYVKFLKRESAENAILYMHGITVCGCRLVVTWGSLVSSALNLTDENAEYQKCSVPPRIAGKLGPVNVNFQRLTTEQILLLELVRETEPMTVDKSNAMHIAHQTNVHKILDEALL